MTGAHLHTKSAECGVVQDPGETGIDMWEEDSSFPLGSRVSVTFGTLSAHGFCACPVILGMGMTPVTDIKFTPTTECDK